MKLQTVTWNQALARFTHRGLMAALLYGALAAATLLAMPAAPAAADDALAEIDLKYYLREDHAYDPQVPTPRSYLGYEIGTRHMQHHELVGYLRAVAKASPRVKLQEYGRTHGGRPLLLLTITSPENHTRLEAIRRAHLRWSNPNRGGQSAKPPKDMPAVLNMGYGIHGNEPSASTAAVVIAYHLAAAQGEAIDDLLANLVVLLDPCLNPDGFERFAHWTNNHRGQVPNADRDHREHQEAFPSGRTNYYWFDLNRDWLLLTQPESRGRMGWYHRWLPNVVLDYHEMGTDSTYFFQPGVPTRRNPWIPDRNVELTAAMAKYHAAALDRLGSQYFTEDQFDDFYPGKGSTYPDLHGAVGILFEQGSSRGQVQESVNGDVTFPFTIRNQVATSLSSLQATFDLREQLLMHQRDFYRENLELAAKDPIKAYVVSAPGDPYRLAAFLDWMRRQNLVYEPLTEAIETEAGKFEPGEAFVVPMRQKDYRFLKAVFEHRTEFAETVFYDVSSWAIPDAYGLVYATLEQWPADLTAKPTPDKDKHRASQQDGKANGDQRERGKDEHRKDGRAKEHQDQGDRDHRNRNQPDREPRPDRKRSDDATAPQPGNQGLYQTSQPSPEPEAKDNPRPRQRATARGAADVKMPRPPAFRGDETACVIDWRGYYAPRLLYQLQKRGFTVKVATQPITIESDGNQHSLGYGTLVVPLGEDRENLAELQTLLRQAAASGVASHAVKGGRTPQGPDLGSGRLSVTRQPKPLLMVGEGINTYEAGEVWHLLDQRFGIPLTLAEIYRVGSMDLSKYTTVIAVSGNYRLLGDAGTKQLKEWVENGGTLIAIGSTGRWLKDAGLADVTLATPELNIERRPYAEASTDSALRLVRGVILQAQIDVTHPLGYGFADRPLAVFRNNEQFVKRVSNPYSNPVIYRESPLLAGYMSERNQSRTEEAASAVVYRLGRGRVVLFSDNPNFRAYWHGTERLFLNAVCFGDLIRVP